ncbi:MAG: Bug family tripartite tricarboxylate transporter substrate binding protein [Candidatus Binatia bacterium]
MKVTIFLLLLGLSFVPSGAVFAEDFYAGKTIRVIVGGSAGGGFDTYSRIIARHMGKHIPGKPNLVVENMTGAATRIAAKYLFSAAQPDGLAFGIFNGYLLLGRVLGMKGLDFDVRKFEWVGVPVQDHVACALHKASGVTNLKEWRSAKTPVKIGALGPGNSTGDVPRLLRATLNLPIQMVEGYKGTADIRIAADGGEVGGACWAWQSIKPTWAKGLQTGEVNVVIQAAPKPHPDLTKVPLAFDLTKNEEGKQLLRAGGLLPSTVTRVYATTPGTPKDRMKILQNAFSATLKDKAFMAEAEKAKLEIDPLTGDEVKKTVGEMFNIDEGLKSKLKTILTSK